MALHDDVADQLAQRTIANLKDLNDTELEARVGDAIGSASPTLQEAYSTAMRIRRAEARAVAVLDRFEQLERQTQEKPAAPKGDDAVQGSTFEKPSQPKPAPEPEKSEGVRKLYPTDAARQAAEDEAAAERERNLPRNDQGQLMIEKKE